MRLKRRDFLRASGALGAALVLKVNGLSELEKMLASESSLPSVVWLQGQSCTGCAVSFLNSVYYMTVDELLLNSVNLTFQSNLMAAAGDSAVEAAETTRSRGGYILIIEGSIPAGAQGEYCHLWPGVTMLDAISAFVPGADVVLSVGTCASYGGIYAAAPNPTGAMGVEQALASLGLTATVINIPGCPVHPDWLVGTVAQLLSGRMPPLDSIGRPRQFFGGEALHENCPLYEVDDANSLGQYGCLEELGCRGKVTHADCPSRKWNSGGTGEYGVEWCIGAGSPCIGCTEPGFPDAMSPFYKHGDDDDEHEDDGEHGDHDTDVITVSKAEYNLANRMLSVEATSSQQPDPVLTVEGYGVMTWRSGSHRYEYTVGPVQNPGGTITVTSSLGASVISTVTNTGQNTETVTILKAKYKRGVNQLYVQATSSLQPDVEMTVDGYGPMVWRGRKYEYKVRGSRDPGGTVTVTSSEGGVASAVVDYSGRSR